MCDTDERHPLVLLHDGGRELRLRGNPAVAVAEQVQEEGVHVLLEAAVDLAQTRAEDDLRVGK